VTWSRVLPTPHSKWANVSEPAGFTVELRMTELEVTDFAPFRASFGPVVGENAMVAPLVVPTLLVATTRK